MLNTCRPVLFKIRVRLILVITRGQIQIKKHLVTRIYHKLKAPLASYADSFAVEYLFEARGALYVCGAGDRT